VSGRDRVKDYTHFDICISEWWVRSAGNIGATPISTRSSAPQRNSASAMSF